MTATGPLAGIRIVERAEGAAAAYAGRMLAVLGAEVTMAEPPGGSALRAEPPFLMQAPEVSALFAYLGAGKKSVVCDLDSHAGRAKLAALLEGADVLLDDTPVAQRAALELDPAMVAARFPASCSRRCCRSARPARARTGAATTSTCCMRAARAT